MKIRALLLATALTAGFTSLSFAQDQGTTIPSNQSGTGQQDSGTTQPLPETQNQTGAEPNASQSTQSNDSQNGTQPVQQGQDTTTGNGSDSNAPVTTQSDQDSTQPIQQGQTPTPSTGNDQDQAQTNDQGNMATDAAFNLPEECRTYGQMANQSQQGSSSTGQNMDMQGMDMNQQMSGNMTEMQRGLHDAMMKSMGPMSTAMMAQDADVAFICAMIPHHQAAIEMARTALREADNAQAKRMAQRIIRQQQREVRQMVNWVRQNAERESRDETQATGSTSPAPQNNMNQSDTGTGGSTTDPQQ